MTFLTSRNRLIEGDGYVLVMEEVTSTVLLHDMFQQMSSLIAGSDKVMEELDEALPTLTGQQFVALHYYEDFVSPSKFQGYCLVMLTIVPDNTNDIIREIIKQAANDNLGRIFLTAARNDADQHKFNVLQNEANRLVQARVNILRRL